MSGRSEAGTCGAVGSKPFSSAYVTKNEYVFQSTSSRRLISSSALRLNSITSSARWRLTVQRITSAPTFSITSSSSTTFSPVLWNSPPVSSSIGSKVWTTR
jgi:hypothetical protein